MSVLRCGQSVSSVSCASNSGEDGKPIRVRDHVLQGAVEEVTGSKAFSHRVRGPQGYLERCTKGAKGPETSRQLSLDTQEFKAEGIEHRDNFEGEEASGCRQRCTKQSIKERQDFNDALLVRYNRQYGDVQEFLQSNEGP